jgi:hypothetical protein
MPIDEYRKWVAVNYPVVVNYTREGMVIMDLSRIGVPKTFEHTRGLGPKDRHGIAFGPYYKLGLNYGFVVDLDTSGTILKAKPIPLLL